MKEEKKGLKISLGTAIYISIIVLAILIRGLVYCYDFVHASQGEDNYSQEIVSEK